jgi:23S rRNA-/tRNA-specific pseudouridylate synthase
VIEDSAPEQIELADGTVIPIVYEDRAVLAIDKPPGWMLAPDSWNRTSRNLQRALEHPLKARDGWARSRGLKCIRFIHRLDAGTSGILLLARSRGALRPFSELSRSRRVAKVYLAGVRGVPARECWVCPGAGRCGSRRRSLSSSGRMASRPPRLNFFRWRSDEFAVNRQ